jgi:putative phosphoesterase
MKIGILSDTHDNLHKLARALEVFRREGVEALLHAGDFVAPFVVPPLARLGKTVYGVFGNNDGERLGLLGAFQRLGPLAEPPLPFTLAETRIVLLHEPILLDPLARSGDFDLIVHGHLHQRESRRLAGALILDPGECCGWTTGKGSVVTLDLAAETLEPVFHEI